MRGNVPLDIFTGWSGFAVLCGVVGLRQTCESVWRRRGGGGLGQRGQRGGKGGGARPAAHSGTRTAARQPQRARSRQELQDVDTEQGPRRGFNHPMYSQDISTACGTKVATFTRLDSQISQLGGSIFGVICRQEWLGY